ncbi:hypothetical protein Q9L58_009662 [Maublancomyces gigas]|uniref:Uncharacterized protein n=1 Tax=Discina gigas TaxID=1032678 RepID=A0ABR3G692_9PEZI
MVEKFVVFCVGGQGIREYGDGRGAIGKEFEIGSVKELDAIEETSGGGAFEDREMLEDTAEDETISRGKADGRVEVAEQAEVQGVINFM